MLSEDGFKRLQTVRLDDENVYTPELNTFTTSRSEDNIFSHAHSKDNSEENLQAHLRTSSSYPDVASARNISPVSTPLRSNKSPPKTPPSVSSSFASLFPAFDARTLEGGVVEPGDSFSSILPASSSSGQQILEGVAPTSSYDAVMAHLRMIDPQTPLRTGMPRDS